MVQENDILIITSSNDDIVSEISVINAVLEILALN